MSEYLEEKVASLEKKLDEANSTIAALNHQMHQVLNYLHNPHLIEQNMRGILGRIQNLETNAVSESSLYFELGRTRGAVLREVNVKIEKTQVKQEELEEKQKLLKEEHNGLAVQLEEITEKLDGMEKIMDVMELD